jgi:TPR repeat protein
MARHKLQSSTDDHTPRIPGVEDGTTANGVAEDKGETFKRFRKAAELGEAKAQCNLGVSYYNGDGVAVDKAQAIKWFRKSAEQGNAKAERNLDRIGANK